MVEALEHMVIQVELDIDFGFDRLYQARQAKRCPAETDDECDYSKTV